MNNIIELLNLKENDVEKCDFIRDKDNVLYIHLTLKCTKAVCPECGSININIHDYRTKNINHPILSNSFCYIKYKCRRYRCKDCNKIFAEENRFVAHDNSSSKYAIAKILKLLKNPRNTFTSVASECNVSVPTVINTFDNLGIIKRNKFGDYICIDEYYDPSTGSGKYNLVFIDFLSNEIIDILSNRSKYYVANYLSKLPKNELLGVKHVSIDMWEPYKEIANLYFKNAIISVDPFHVMKHVITALDKTRLRILRQFDKRTDEYYLLKKFAYLLFKNHSNLNYYEPKLNHKLGVYLNSKQTLDLILNISNELKLVYDLKEKYHHFNTSNYSDDKRTELNEIIKYCRQSKIDELIELSKTLYHWKDEIINSFHTYNKKRITNGPIEATNSLIRVITSNANGYRNFARERNRIMYCINKSYSFLTYKKKENQ